MPRLDLVLHPGLEDEVAALAAPLRPVHRDVGVAQQLFGARRRSPVAMPMLALTRHRGLAAVAERERLA